MSETVQLPDNLIGSEMYFIDNLYTEREARRTENIIVNQLSFNGLL